MDPMSVLRTMWRHKWLALPAVILTLAGALYVLAFGPRLYESSETFVLINPAVPSAQDLINKPSLAGLNADNPYLRSSDPALVAQVLISRLNSDMVAQQVVDAGLGPTYTVVSAGSGSGLLIQITGDSDTAKKSLATTELIGQQFVIQLKAIQKVNGADDVYLFTSLLVDPPDQAKERLSSRLRSLVMVCAGGFVLIFGVVSIAEMRDRSRRRSWSAPTQGGRRPQSTTAQKHLDSPRAGEGFSSTSTGSAHEVDYLFASNQNGLPGGGPPRRSNRLRPRGERR